MFAIGDIYQPTFTSTGEGVGADICVDILLLRSFLRRSSLAERGDDIRKRLKVKEGNLDKRMTKEQFFS